MIRFLLLLPILTAPIGVPILGYIALSRIRHLRGRLYGLGMALFDVLFFPLLALDALIGWCWYATLTSRLYPATWESIASAGFVLVLTVVTSAVADFLIVRSAWRAVSRPVGNRPQNGSESPAPPLPPDPLANRKPSLGSHTFMWGIAMLAILALALVLDSFVDGVVVDRTTGKGQGGYTGLELLLRVPRPGALAIGELFVGVLLLVCVAAWGLRTLRVSHHREGPSLSRTAIVGAALGTLSLFLPSIWLYLMLLPAPATGSKPPVPSSGILVAIFALAAIGGVFGTTILGLVSLSQIRRSAGRLYGLGLALFDALLYPMLVLDWFIGVFCTVVTVALRDTLGPRGGGEPDWYLVALLTIPVAAIVDFFVVRAAWRSVQGSVNDSKKQDRSNPDRTDASQDTLMKHHTTIAYLGLALVLVSFFALIAALSFESSVAWIRSEVVHFGAFALATFAFILGVIGRKTLPGKITLGFTGALLLCFLGMFLWKESPSQPAVKMPPRAVRHHKQEATSPRTFMQRESTILECVNEFKTGLVHLSKEHSELARVEHFPATPLGFTFVNNQIRPRVHIVLAVCDGPLSEMQAVPAKYEELSDIPAVVGFELECEGNAKLKISINALYDNFRAALRKELGAEAETTTTRGG